jgi:hypothetical protein
MNEVDLPEFNLSAWQWWESHRLRYNIGLAISGILAFVAYIVVLYIFNDRIPDAEITAFTILFQGIGYLLFIGIANVFYFLGSISEKLPRIRDLESHRRMTYSLGFWLSVAMPFLVPITVAYNALFQPNVL